MNKTEKLEISARQKEQLKRVLDVMKEHPILTSVFGGDAHVYCRMDGVPYVNVTYSYPRWGDGALIIYEDEVVFMERSNGERQFGLSYDGALKYLIALAEGGDTKAIIDEDKQGGYIGGRIVHVDAVYRVPSSKPGKTYLVVRFSKNDNTWTQCSCKVFKYRKTCRHIQELTPNSRNRYEISYKL